MSTDKYLFIDARALMERLGGIPAVQLMFEDADFRPIHQRNIYKWIERGSISSSRILEILWLISDRKLKVDLLDFVEARPVEGPTTTEENNDTAYTD